MFFRILLESYRTKRNFPSSFIINWIGLTLGFTVVILMYLHISRQIDHDTNYAASTDNIYRLEIPFYDFGGITVAPLGKFAQERFPEVEAACKIQYMPLSVATDEENPTAIKTKILLSDSTFLRVFPYKLLEGDPQHALDSRQGAIISRQTAEKLFGSASPIGKRIRIMQRVVVFVEGVYEDMGDNAAFSPGIVANSAVFLEMINASDRFFESWHRYMYENYIVLKPGTDLESFSRKYKEALVEKFSELQETTVVLSESQQARMYVTPFNDLYFNGGKISSFSKSVDPQSLFSLGLIGLLILIIGILNYVNIYTSRSLHVVRTMAVKLVFGAGRKELIVYTLCDSTLIALFSAISAYVVALAFEPFYPAIIGMEIPVSLSLSATAVIFVLLPVITGILAGLFPAFSFSSVKPINAMGSKKIGDKRVRSIRNILIVIQFCISIGLIAATLIINRQIRYVQSMDLGYNRDNVVVLNGEDFALAKIDLFRDRVMQNQDIVAVSILKDNITQLGEYAHLQISNDESEDGTRTLMMWSDEYVFDILGIRIEQGDKAAIRAMMKSDRKNVYLANQVLAGNYQNMNAGKEILEDERFVGIIRNFSTSNLYETQPLVLGPILASGYDYGNIYIRIDTENLEETLKFIERTFKEVYPNAIYEMNFLDDLYNNVYKEEILFRKRLTLFSLLAVAIACMGLSALVGYSVERRRKEIALRKINGASSASIIWMLCSSFVKLLGIAFLITVPIIYWLMKLWIVRFVHSAGIDWSAFVISGGITLALAMGTIFWQSYSAARENPAKIFRE